MPRTLFRTVFFLTVFHALAPAVVPDEATHKAGQSESGESAFRVGQVWEGSYRPSEDQTLRFRLKITNIEGRRLKGEMWLLQHPISHAVAIAGSYGDDNRFELTFTKRIKGTWMEHSLKDGRIEGEVTKESLSGRWIVPSANSVGSFQGICMQLGMATKKRGTGNFTRDDSREARAAATAGDADGIKIYPALEREPLSKQYTVHVNGKPCPVYAAKVAHSAAERRYYAMDNPKQAAGIFEMGSFAYFDMRRTVDVTVTCPAPIQSTKVLPKSSGITPLIRGNTLKFTLLKPRPLTIEVNGNCVGSLHIFANPYETDAPRPDDPNVIYFGPGIHEVGHLFVGDNKTIYVAGGAIVRCVVRPNEEFKFPTGVSPGVRHWIPAFDLGGQNITLRGRGIIDASGFATHDRSIIRVRGNNVAVEGVILRDPGTRGIHLAQSDDVTVTNLKLIGYRPADGIDIVSSRDVRLEGCFVRSLDDCIAIKTDVVYEVRRIVVKDCVLWNEVANALVVGAELRGDVDDVLFTNCDVIHDKGRCWTLAVGHSDAGLVSNIRFKDIRVEDSRRLLSVSIVKDMWSTDQERGHVRGVTFENIRASGNPLSVELKGFDCTHGVEGVMIRNVVVNGKVLTAADINTNQFVRRLFVRP